MADIFYWQENIQGVQNHCIWLKLELADSNLDVQINQRRQQNRPFLKIELLRIFNDILSALMEAEKHSIFNRGTNIFYFSILFTIKKMNIKKYFMELFKGIII